VNPFTLSDKVVEPGDATAQPVDVDAAATDTVPATGTTRARRPMVVAATTALTTPDDFNLDKRCVTWSSFISDTGHQYMQPSCLNVRIAA
jgi:hypothetical protein